MTLEDPPFFVRKKRHLQQCRFHVDPDVYTDFKTEVKRQQLYIQDVFEELMKYFTRKSKRNELYIDSLPENETRVDPLDNDACDDPYACCIHEPTEALAKHRGGSGSDT